MKIERVISWFDKRTEILQGEFNVDHIDLAVLKSIFSPKEEDPLMYDPYLIDISHVAKLQNIIDFQFDFDLFVYEIDCFQV